MQLQYHKMLQIGQSTLAFDTTESRHIVKVLRHKVGNLMYVTNGNGLLIKGQITSANPKQCELKVVETIEQAKIRPYQLHIAIAPTKNIDRFEWFLEKATEIGIDRITPIVCEHSERKIIKPERLEKILVSAMKQSAQYYLPVLDDLQDYKTFIQQPFGGQRFIAHCLPNHKQDLKALINQSQHFQILIGPEGDFSEQEINKALDQNFTPISLGQTRLRTETAGIVATHTVSLIHIL